MEASGTALGDFFSDLQSRFAVIRNYREKLNRVLAEEFNLVDFLGPDEYRLSELIALLLDPKGSHAQGAAFLKRFLARLQSEQTVSAAADMEKALANGGDVHVALEEPTRQKRRIDLVLSAGQTAIGIENKPWAGDLDAQLYHYADYLARSYPASWALIYLRGDGGRPAETSLPSAVRDKLLKQGNYAEWSYRRELADWLELCGKVCEADKLRWLLRDFHAYVLNNFRSG